MLIIGTAPALKCLRPYTLVGEVSVNLSEIQFIKFLLLLYLIQPLFVLADR